MTRPDRFKVGDVVLIEGKLTILISKLSDIEGGWIVCPRIDNIQSWNEDAMWRVRPESTKKGARSGRLPGK